MNGEDRKMIKALANQQIGFEATVGTKLDNIQQDVAEIRKGQKEMWKSISKVAADTLVNSTFREQHIIDHSDNFKNAIIIIGVILTVVTVTVNVGIALLKG